MCTHLVSHFWLIIAHFWPNLCNVDKNIIISIFSSLLTCNNQQVHCVNNAFLVQYSISNRLLDSLVEECWHRVREVPGSIPSQGPRHTQDVIKMAVVAGMEKTEWPRRTDKKSKAKQKTTKKITRVLSDVKDRSLTKQILNNVGSCYRV